MIDFVLEKASDNDLYIISQYDEDLQIRYEATRQLQGRYKRKKAKHKKYWSNFKTFKEE